MNNRPICRKLKKLVSCFAWTVMTLRPIINACFIRRLVYISYVGTLARGRVKSRSTMNKAIVDIKSTHRVRCCPGASLWAYTLLRHRSSYGKTWRNPQNRKYKIYCNLQCRERSIEPRTQATCKGNLLMWTYGFRDILAERHTQTNKQTCLSQYCDRNQGRSNDVLYLTP